MVANMQYSLKQQLTLLAKKAIILLIKMKSKPLWFLGIFAIFLIIIFWLVSDNVAEQTKSASVTIEFEEQETPEIDGIKASVDPRDMWVAKTEEKIQQNSDNLTRELDQKHSDLNQEIVNLKNEIIILKESLQLAEQKWLEEKQKPLQLDQIVNTSKSNSAKQVPVTKKFIHLTNNSTKINKDLKYYIPAGTFARGVLMTGVVAGTGTNSVDAPEPIMIRLSHHGIFSKQNYLKNIKEAILIGSCVGEIRSERAKCRLKTLSLKDNKGKIIEKEVQGWIVGEDGRVGVRGLVVDKSSEVIRMAVISGLLGGMSKFMESQATKQTTPMTMLPISENNKQNTNTISATNSIKGGIYSGASNAFDKLADFAIKRADQLSPVIVISSGREVDVLFSEGVSLLDEAELKVNNVDFNQSQNSNYQNQYDETIEQINQENLNQDNYSPNNFESSGEF